MSKHLVEDIREHINHYAVLSIWFMAGLWALIRWRFNIQIQFYVVIIMAAGYVLWGTIHHALLKDLKGKIVVEYVLVAGLSVLFFWLVLMQT